MHTERTQGWTWLICAILFLATFLNYANRVTFTQNPQQVRQTFHADEADFGRAEAVFGWGFAAGGLLFGILADQFTIRWLYPLVVVAWSVAGIATGVVETLSAYELSRFCLGLFEAGHWPCSLRMTQRTFHPAQRTLGNSILQSGASFGQVLTPLLIVALARWDASQWRWSCCVVGAAGLPWIILWLSSVREADVSLPVIQTDEHAAGVGQAQVIQEVPFLQLFATRRWWLLLVVVVCINTPWHYVRVWMPDTLQTDHHYEKTSVDYFTSAYYAATFVGSLFSGWITMRLVRGDWNVHRARLAAFLFFGLLAACSVPAAFASRGPILLGLLLVVAFGSLGLFPIYYSFAQELSGKNQGKVGGLLGFSTWSLLGLMQWQVGALVKHDPLIRPYLFGAVGILPLVAFAVLALFWGKRPAQQPPQP